MKKLIFWFIFITVIVSGCTGNIPVQIDINATVESAVSSALAANKDFVRQEILDYSQNVQNTQIASQIDQKINNAISELKLADVNLPMEQLTVTPTLSISSNTKDGCTNRFEYVSDVTFPDGSMTLPYTTFTKSWYIQNTGTCTWNSKYKIVYYSGDNVGTAKSFPLFTSDKIAKPGESIIASVKLYAGEGHNNDYTTYWSLQSDDGEIFNGGTAQNIPLSSVFHVGSQYNFYDNLSGAICSDNTGYFYCGSSDKTSGRGVAFYESNPTVESNYAGQPAIIIAPPLIDGGKTSVTFGPVRVPRGTWLRSSISCRPNAPLCNAKVRLYVQVEGLTPQIVTESQEFNDGFVTEWNVQLSDYGYHDQDLTYTFEVEAIGGADKDDEIVFQVPRLTDKAPIL
ncbi:MAG: hypothetical protein GYA26_02025 [Flexilinea flocculi]|nr:hypothetical protein [Flexilinea flocculi]